MIGTGEGGTQESVLNADLCERLAEQALGALWGREVRWVGR